MTSIRFACLAALLVITATLLVAGADAAPAARTCGGIAGIACGTGEFCQLPAGKCGALDVTGTCAKIPDVCTEQYQPVCGCDGKTYSNDCKRRAAKISKKADGACKA